MSKNELVQIAKLIQVIVEREVQKNTKPLLSEIKRLNSRITLLTEIKQKPRVVSKTKKNISDMMSEGQTASSRFTNDNFEINKPNIYQSIFENIVPFDDEPEVESVLDYRVPGDSDPVSKVLNKLQTTDFKRTLQIMEQSASRHNNSQINSQMHR